MKVSYYPGCSLHGTAREYDESTRAVAGALDIDLEELPDWNCCGASSAHATSESLALELAARNLAIAGRLGKDLVVPCAACFSRLKAAQSGIVDAGAGDRINAPRVLSLLEFLGSPDLLESIASLVTNPLKGLSTASYYGCLLVRPPGATGASHHEFPETMDRLMALLGASPIAWSYKTDCCGASLVLSRKDIVLDTTARILTEASKAGAEAIVVACPLCQSNLDTRQEELASMAKPYNIPVFYFTEMIGVGLGLKDARRWMKRHFVDPTNLLASKGLITR
jgi:heterodisulfide reductase subunit B